MARSTVFETVPVTELMERGMIPEVDYRQMALVVDDERVIADTLVAILEGHGYAATAAYDGEGALEIAGLIPPDVLISDVIMPGMNGIDLAVQLKSLIPGLGILLFSGQAATGNLMAKARELAEDFEVFAKPMHPRELLAKVQALSMRSMA